MITALDVPTATAAALLRHVSVGDSSDPFADERSRCRDLGFGAQSCTIHRSGGYADFDIAFALIGEEVIARQLVISVSGESANAVLPVLEVAFFPNLPLTRQGSKLLWRSPSAPSTVPGRGIGMEALGRAPSAKVDAGLENHFLMLMDPLARLVFGEVCYESADPPPGRNEIAALQKAGRYDLVSVVLRSLNPEARIYAAEALLKHQAEGGQVSDDDMQAIDVIRGMDLQIRRCRECIVSRAQARELLAEFEQVQSNTKD